LRQGDPGLPEPPHADDPLASYPQPPRWIAGLEDNRVVRGAIVIMMLLTVPACGQAATPSAAGSARAASPTPEAQAATGVCKAFYVNGGVDLAEAAFQDELQQQVDEALGRGGRSNTILIDLAARAFDEGAAQASGNAAEDMAALADAIRTGNSSDDWYDALTRFEERYAAECGVDLS
jgi:hypothetical protein